MVRKSSQSRKTRPRIERFKRQWHKFSSNSLSLIGLIVVVLLFLTAVCANLLAPYPEHSGLFLDFSNANMAPSLQHIAGTDDYGRDILSRMLVGLRYSLGIGLLVIGLSVPIGVVLGLVAAYFKNTWIDTAIMRFTDLFMAIPPLILALVVCATFTPGYFFAAIGISTAWWPWYTRLAYSLSTSLSNELYVKYADLEGAGAWHIILKETLPNAVSPIFTKMSLDMGMIIIIASSMSFVGLGVQPPAPSLGSMVSEGMKHLPEFWWISIFPALMVVLIVLGFNLLGDGLRDVFAVEEI